MSSELLLDDVPQPIAEGTATRRDQAQGSMPEAVPHLR